MRHHIGATAQLPCALAVGLLLALPGRVAAQRPLPATDAAPPSAEADDATNPTRTILIEALQVEGTRRDSVQRVVLSESRLVGGERYTEQAIARAVRRVKRLPFILDARPTLRRGSAPGRYVLVIVVEEHSPLSFGVAGDHWSDSPENMSTGKVSPNIERFFGSLTQLHLSVDMGARRRRAREWSRVTVEPDNTPLSANVTLGLTRYDIVRPASRLDVSFSAGRELCTAKDFLTEHPLCDVGTGWAVNGSLLLPFARDNSLTLFAGFRSYRTTDSVGLLFGDNGALERVLSPPEKYAVKTRRVRLGAIWAHDTTDDAIAPREGRQIVVGLSAWLDSDDYPAQVHPLLEDTGGAIPVLRYQQLLPLSRGLSVSAVAAPLGGLVSGGDDTYGEASLGLRWVHAGRRNRYRLSLESGLIAAAGGSGATRDARHWMPYSSVRFRSGLLVVSLDARWAR